MGSPRPTAGRKAKPLQEKIRQGTYRRDRDGPRHGDERQAERESEARAAVPVLREAVPGHALVPQLRRGVVDPRRIGRGEREHVKRVALLLVRVRARVGDRGVALDRMLHRPGRDDLGLVPLRPHHVAVA